MSIFSSLELALLSQHFNPPPPHKKISFRSCLDTVSPEQGINFTRHTIWVPNLSRPYPNAAPNVEANSSRFFLIHHRGPDLNKDAAALENAFVTPLLVVLFDVREWNLNRDSGYIHQTDRFSSPSHPNVFFSIKVLDSRNTIEQWQYKRVLKHFFS